MDEKSGMPSEQELKEFLGLTTHSARCAYFNDHPSLARIYRAAHFPKTEIVQVPAPVKTKE